MECGQVFLRQRSKQEFVMFIVVWSMHMRHLVRHDIIPAGNQYNVTDTSGECLPINVRFPERGFFI